MQIQPPSILLLGGPGSGKTWSLSTLLEAGLEVFVLVTEPTGLDSLLDAVEQKKLNLTRLFWRQITPTRPGFESLLKIAKNVSLMSFKDIANLPPSPGRQDARWIELLKNLQNFNCERTGMTFGDVTTWGPGRAFAIDSLSGLNVMAWDMVVGDRPTGSPGEWGVAMNLLEKLILSITSGMKCTFVLTAHLEREIDETTNMSQLMASTLGRKLAPKLPRFFSEIAMAHRQADKFFWSTSALGVDLKKRALPLGHELQPSFTPVIDAYKRRLKLAAKVA